MHAGGNLIVNLNFQFKENVSQQVITVVTEYTAESQFSTCILMAASHRTWRYMTNQTGSSLCGFLTKPFFLKTGIDAHNKKSTHMSKC